MLRALNLRNADGTNFDPTTYSQLNTWLKNANSSPNMANMLSAQLAAMELNVYNGKVQGSALIQTSGLTPSFDTVNHIMSLANGELGAHAKTLSGDPNRTYQEGLKNILDAANRNTSYVEPSPANCPAPTFAQRSPMLGTDNVRLALKEPWRAAPQPGLIPKQLF